MASGGSLPTPPDWQDWLNELAENMPEHYDGDYAMEEYVTQYVRGLEEIARCARGTIRTAHPAIVRDGVVSEWWDALRVAVKTVDGDFNE